MSNTTYFIETRPLDSDDARAWTDQGIGDIIEHDSADEAWDTIADLQRMDLEDPTGPSWAIQYRVVGSDGTTEDASEAASRKRDEFLELFARKLDRVKAEWGRLPVSINAIAFENQALGVGDEFLPACAIAVRTGGEATVEYWAWLCGQVGK